MTGSYGPNENHSAENFFKALVSRKIIKLLFNLIKRPGLPWPRTAAYCQLLYINSTFYMYCTQFLNKIRVITLLSEAQITWGSSNVIVINENTAIGTQITIEFKC